MRYTNTLVLVFLTSYLFGQALVLPGDFPDPSAVKIGDRYWATATTSNWGPAFPLLESKDLHKWELKGHVFSLLPDWADFYFWAPEISWDKGKVYVYYAAHRRGGNLCIGVASADRPEGPYRDHGPLLCQEDGSIDAWPVRDEHGKLYLVWKEDGNSVKLPTPIWAMEMDEGRTRLIGEKKELFRNDAPWEGNLVEGISMMRHGKYFYAFYAGAACCGRACSYGTGVARSRKLLGPWEKYPGNPVLGSKDEWKCPGHGTPIERNGKYYFLHHAYNDESSVYAGRQGVLSEFTFTKDGWIKFVNTESDENATPGAIEDDFNGDNVSPLWQWSVFQKVHCSQKGGQLALMALPERSGAFLGMKTYKANYHAEVMLHAAAGSAESGLALIGDEKNFVMVTVKDKRVSVTKVEADKETVIKEIETTAGEKITLRLTVKNGKDISFAYSADGENFTLLNEEPVDGFFLPPWDRAVRVALVAKGETSQKALFDNFILKND